MAYLRIGFADYELCPTPEGDASLLLGNRVCVGKVSHFEQKIYYRDDLNGQCQLQVILHECIHIADWQAGTDDTDDFDKEKQIDRYANFLLQFLRDNPDFVSLVSECADVPIKAQKKEGEVITQYIDGICVEYPPIISAEEAEYYVKDEVARWQEQGKKISTIKIIVDDDNWVVLECKEKSPITRTRRITGYCSNISNFNDAKLAELADRQKHIKGA